MFAACLAMRYSSLGIGCTDCEDLEKQFPVTYASN